MAAGAAAGAAALLGTTLLLVGGCPATPPGSDSGRPDPGLDAGTAQLRAGREIFRYDTFGSEAFWGGALRLHEAIAGSARGGVGAGLSPAAALGLGLKVDQAAVPAPIQAAIANNQVDLADPNITLLLLQIDAVVGVKGFFDDAQRLTSVGIRCAICHSTVDDALAPGIGARRDGWANRDLDIGAIIALAPTVAPFAEVLDVDEAAVRTVLRSWGPGKFDAQLILDGKAFRPDGRSGATRIPPAFGLAGVNLHTWTGFGSVPYWNAFVAVLEMHGQGRFVDERLRDANQFPVAAANGFFDVNPPEDLVTPKLPALHAYQLALAPPRPPSGSFDPAAAARGETVFFGKADCARCHVPPLYTEPGYNMHRPEAIGIDSFQSDRSPQRRYRTAPLRGLWSHATGGFYHDGRFSTLEAVIDHYNGVFDLDLTEAEQSDLVQFLLSI